MIENMAHFSLCSLGFNVMPTTCLATNKFMLIQWMAQPLPLFALVHSALATVTIHSLNTLLPIPSACLCYEWVFFQWPPCQIHTHLLRSSSNVTSLRARWRLIHLSVTCTWHRVKLTKFVLNEQVNEQKGQSQYPIADQNMSFVVWQTWIHSPTSWLILTWPWSGYIIILRLLFLSCQKRIMTASDSKSSCENKMKFCMENPSPQKC